MHFDMAKVSTVLFLGQRNFHVFLKKRSHNKDVVASERDTIRRQL
jgi:hypothetical protein